jgi:hypothetical protein
MIPSIKDIPAIIREYKQIGNTKTGLICLVIAACICYKYFIYNTLKETGFWPYDELWIVVLISFIIFIAWLIYSKRLFFRDNWYVLFWLAGLLLITLSFPVYIYPRYIRESIVDLPHIALWGTVIVAIVVWIVMKIIRRYCFRGGKLIVAFVVNPDGVNAEAKIRHSIKQTIADIEDEFPDIKIVVPSFGFKTKIKDCEKYIKNPFMQADALIYAKLTEGMEDGGLGYVFTKFTSRVNENRHSNFNAKSNQVLDGILEQQRTSKEWNNLNTSKKECISKLKLANNLKSMLLMFCSSLYLLKNDANTALPVAKQMYNVESSANKNTLIHNTAKQLLKFAYLSSALNIEHKRHNFGVSHEHLQECARLFPELNNDPTYLKSMARIAFYLNGIDESKKYTQKFKQIEGTSWGYYLNMGFYAMYDNKAQEFVSHYRQLVKHKTDLFQVQFAIEFLQYQLQECERHPYKMYLEYAIAILTHYHIDTSKGQKMYVQICDKYSARPEYPRLDALIMNDKRLQIC